MRRRFVALAVLYGLLSGDVRPTPPMTLPPDWSNTACMIGIKIDGHPWCHKIVWLI